MWGRGTSDQTNFTVVDSWHSTAAASADYFAADVVGVVIVDWLSTSPLLLSLSSAVCSASVWAPTESLTACGNWEQAYEDTRDPSFIPDVRNPSAVSIVFDALIQYWVVVGLCCLTVDWKIRLSVSIAAASSVNVQSWIVQSPAISAILSHPPWFCNILDRTVVVVHLVLICHHVLAATNWFCWHCTVVLQQQCDNAT